MKYVHHILVSAFAMATMSLPPVLAQSPSQKAAPTASTAPVIVVIPHSVSLLGPTQSAEAITTENEYHDDIVQGNQALKNGHTAAAISAFQQARAIQPEDGEALVGLADAYTAAGQTDQALTAYRNLFYHEPGRRWTSSEEGEPIQLMKFALLLQQANHSQEAVTAYDRGATILNYDMGKPRQAVMLPSFGNGPDQVPYDPQALIAMAHLAIGMDTPGFDSQELQDAVTLAPDSAAAHYYLGKYLYGLDNKKAKDELQKAVQLGDDQTVAAAQQYLQFLK